MYITCGMFWPHDSAHWCNNKTTLALKACHDIDHSSFYYCYTPEYMCNNWHLQDIWADSVPVMQGMFIQQGPSVCVNRSGRSQPSCREWLLVRELAKKHCSAVRTMAGTMLVFFFVLQEAESLSQSLPVNVNFNHNILKAFKEEKSNPVAQWVLHHNVSACWKPLVPFICPICQICLCLTSFSFRKVNSRWRKDDEKMPFWHSGGVRMILKWSVVLDVLKEQDA